MNSPDVGEELSLNPLRGVEPLITIVVVGWMGTPAPREGQHRREASAQSYGLLGEAAGLPSVRFLSLVLRLPVG